MSSSTPKPTNTTADPPDLHLRDVAALPRIAVLIGLTALLMAVAMIVPLNPDGAATLAVRGAAPDERSRDEQLHRAAIGTWRDFYQGRRTMTLREDGTATMVVELSGIKARLFTPRLELDIVWSVEDGRMKRRTVGGTPADKVAFVNKRAGKQVAEPILELTEDRLRLLDRNGKTEYEWHRVR